MRERVCRKGSAVPANQDDVRSVVTKLAPQFRLHIDVQIQHRRGDSSGHDHGKERRDSPPAAEHRGSHQHPKKHGGVRRLRAAGGHVLRRMPRGSQFTSQREHRVEPHRFANGGRASGKRNHNGNR